MGAFDVTSNDVGEEIAGRFVLERLAGRGGMGAVYRAIDRQDGRPVALKLITESATKGVAESAERFVREAHALASLDHPAIVRYVAHGRAPSGTLYLAMEWLEGETLGQRLLRAPLTANETVFALARVADALAHAHARGFIHRDIKPDNLFLPDSDPAAIKVLDFGIARARGEARAQTRTGVMIGTPGYMAPEQARGERAIDARVDVFALGCVLFECLAGAPAFVGEGVMAVLAKILFEDARRLREVRPDLPAALDELVARMLAKDREGRPADCARVAAELGSLSTIREGNSAGPVSSVAAGLTSDEQRLVSVILAAPSVRRIETALTLLEGAASVASPAGGTDEENVKSREVRALAASFGARLEPLVGGALLAVVTSGGHATDQAVQAARFALALQRALAEDTIALATGRASVSGRLPVGDVIDRAARLVEKSCAGDAAPSAFVWIDELTAGLVAEKFEVVMNGDARTLHGARDAERARTLLGKTTRCVGREREIARLSSLFDECVEERAARPTLVTAPPGTGKSRLREEAVRVIRDRHPDAVVLTGWCEPMRAGAPLALLASTIARAIAIRDGEPTEQRRRKLLARLARTLQGEDLARVSAFVAELLGIPLEGPEAEWLQAARARPALMSEQIRASFVLWVRAECAAAPVLLVFEDLHWGDAPTIRVVDSALRDLAELPLMVLAFARPELEELFPRLWAERGVEHLRLRELSRKASEALVRQVLGETLDEATLNRIVQRAAGNAFFLEELVRAYEDGRGESLPETVLAMAQRRFEGLSDDTRRTLRAASVFGEIFWQNAVERLLGQAGAGDWMGTLVERELVVERSDSRFPGEVEYAFRHALVRDAAYASLTEGDRRVAHKVAAEWLDRHGEPEALVLADHLERALDPLGAADAYARAAGQALARNDFLMALANADKALALGASSSELRGLHLIRARALSAASRFGEAQPAFESALALAASAPELAIEICTELSLAYGWGSGLVASLSYGERALALAEQTNRPALVGMATASLALVKSARGDIDESARLYRRARELFPKICSVSMTAYPNLFYWTGAHDEGATTTREMLADARAVEDLTFVMYAQPMLALMLAGRGDYGAALRATADAVALGSTHAMAGLTARALAMTGGLHLDLGDAGGAEALTRRAIALAQSVNFHPAVVSAHIDLLCLFARTGRLDQCDGIAALVAEAVAKTAGFHAWIWAVRFLAAKAEVALARGEAEVALEHLESVVAQPPERERPKYRVLGLILRGRARALLGAHGNALGDLRDALSLARRTREPLLLLRAAGALLSLDEQGEARREAGVAAAAIEASIDDERLRRCFAASELVVAVRR